MNMNRYEQLRGTSARIAFTLAIMRSAASAAAKR